MAYSLHTDVAPRRRTPGVHRAGPKTHTPVSQLQERGLRYYSAALGRWVSRDPSDESGGENLYVFAVNSGVNKVDSLGLVPMPFPPGSGSGWLPSPMPAIPWSVSLGSSAFVPNPQGINGLFGFKVALTYVYLGFRPAGTDQMWILTKIKAEGMANDCEMHTESTWEGDFVRAYPGPIHWLSDTIAGGYGNEERDISWCNVDISFERAIGFGSGRTPDVDVTLTQPVYQQALNALVGPTFQHSVHYSFKDPAECCHCDPKPAFGPSEVLSVDSVGTYTWP